MPKIATIEIDSMDYVKTVKRIHDQGGGLTEVCQHYYPKVDPDSDEFKQLKTTLSGQASAIRNQLVAECKKAGVDVAKIDVIFPKFRKPRTTISKTGLNSLMALMAEVGDETADETDGEELLDDDAGESDESDSDE